MEIKRTRSDPSSSSKSSNSNDRRTLPQDRSISSPPSDGIRDLTKYLAGLTYSPRTSHILFASTSSFVVAKATRALRLFIRAASFCTWFTMEQAFVFALNSVYCRERVDTLDCSTAMLFQRRIENCDFGAQINLSIPLSNRLTLLASTQRATYLQD